MSLDILMNHEDAKRFVKEHGIEAFVDSFESEFGYGFYCCKSDWWMDDPKYICKLLGRYGDIIIGWYGVHD
jgi:hypothetical protein